MPIDRLTNQRAKQEFLLLAVIVLAGMILRTYLAGLPRVVRWDEPDYLTLGRNLVTGHGFQTRGVPEVHYAPLFPLLTGLFYLLTGDLEAASEWVYVLFGSLLVIPVYFITRHVYGRRAAVIAALLLVTFPALAAGVLYWGTMTEPLFLTLLYSGLALAFLAWQIHGGKQWRLYAGAGICLSLAYLTKPEASLYFVVVLAFFGLVALVQGQLSQPVTWVRWLVFVLAFTLVASPYTVYLYRHTGRLLVTGKLGVTYFAGKAIVELDPEGYDRALASLDHTGHEIIWFSEDRFQYDVLKDILADPGRFVRRVWRNVNRLEPLFFSRPVFAYYFLPFVALAMFGQPWRRTRLAQELFLLMCLVPMAAFLPFHIEVRYFAPAFIILLMWTARGLEQFGEWLTVTILSQTGFCQGEAFCRERGLLKRIFGSALRAVPVMLVLAYFALMLPQTVSQGMASLSFSHKEAGLWLRQHVSPDSLVMSRDSEIALYAGTRWLVSPYASIPEFMAYARYHGADYLVIDEREATVVRPQLAPFLDTAHPPAGVEHLYTATDQRGRTIIYRILKP